MSLILWDIWKANKKFSWNIVWLCLHFVLAKYFIEVSSLSLIIFTLCFSAKKNNCIDEENMTFCFYHAFFLCITIFFFFFLFNDLLNSGRHFLKPFAKCQDVMQLSLYLRICEWILLMVPGVIRFIAMACRRTIILIRKELSCAILDYCVGGRRWGSILER